MIDASALLTEYLKESGWIVVSEVFNNDTEQGTITIAHLQRRLDITIEEGVRITAIGAPLEKPIDLHHPDSLEAILKAVHQNAPNAPHVEDCYYDEYD